MTLQRVILSHFPGMLDDRTIIYDRFHTMDNPRHDRDCMPGATPTRGLEDT